MRVTDTILQRNFLSNLSQSSERLYEQETRVLTNKRVNKPSDNPVDAINSMVIRTKLDEIDQYDRNISRAKGLLENSETVIAQLSDMFDRVKVLTIQGASDTSGPMDKLSISYEVNQIIEQLFNAANNRSESTYVFAGTYNNAAPYRAVRNEQGQIEAVTSNGSTGDINRIIGENITIKTNVNGEELFEQGGNLFDTLISVRDNLEANDSDALRENLTALNDSSEKINNTRAVVGSRVNRIESAAARNESDKFKFTEYLSNTEDIDAAEAIIDYQAQLLTLQSSLQAGARILLPKLGDFLR